MVRVLDDQAEISAALTGLTTSNTAGILWEHEPTDLAAHFRDIIEPLIGFDVDSLFDVSVVDIERRLDVVDRGDGIEVFFDPLGLNRLTYEVFDANAGPDAAPEATGTTDAFDVPEILQAQRLDPEGNWRVEFHGDIDLDPSTNFSLSSGANFSMEIGGEEFLTSTGNGAGGTFEVPFLASHAFTATILSTPDDPAERVDLTIDGVEDVFERLRRTSDTTITAELNGELSSSILRFDTLEEMSDALTEVFFFEGFFTGEFTVDAEGRLEIEEAGTYILGGSVEIEINGQTIAAGTTEEVLLDSGSHIYSFHLPADTPYNLSFPGDFDEGEEETAEPAFTITKSGPDTGGATVSITGRREALSDPLLEEMDRIAEEAQSVFDVLSLLSPDLGVVEVNPTFNASLGIDAELGWDIDFDGLSRTATEQPASFRLHAPDEVSAGATFTVFADNLIIDAPTTRSSGVEISSIDLTASLELPETQIKDVGVSVSTGLPFDDALSEFLGGTPVGDLLVAFDNFITLDVKSDATLSLEEAIGAANEVASAFGVDGDLGSLLDLGAFFRGLFSGQVDFQQVLSNIAAAVQTQNFGGVINEILGIINVGQNLSAEDIEAELVTITALDGREIGLSGSALLPLVTKATLIGADEGRFVTTELAGLGTVQLPTADILSEADNLGLVDMLGDLRDTLMAGVTPITGLDISAEIPLNNVSEFEGFDVGDVASRGAFGTITSTSSFDLLSIDVDLEKLANEAAIKAVDDALAVPNLPAKVQAVLVAARIGLAIKPQLLEIIEEGASAELSVNPAPLLEAAYEAFFDLLNQGINGLNTIPGIDIPQIVVPNIDFSDEAALKTALTNFLSPFTGVVEDLLGLVQDGLNEVLDLLAPLVTAVGTGLSDAVLAGVQAVQLASNGIQIILNEVINIVNAAEAVDFLNAIPDNAVSVLNDLKGTVATFTGDVVTNMETAATTVTTLANDVSETLLEGLSFETDGLFDDVVDSIAAGLASAAQGMSIRGDMDLDIAEMLYGFDLTLHQTTVFNPDQAMIEYVYGDQSVIVPFGQAAEFTAPQGDVPRSVEARLLLDGAYDYIYTIETDHDLDFELLTIDISGDLTLGSGDPLLFGDPDDPTQPFTYSLLKTVDDLPDAIGDQFDQALIEIPANAIIGEIETFFIDALLNNTLDLVRADVGVDEVDAPTGQIGLFRVNGVDASEGDTEGFAAVVAQRDLTFIATEGQVVAGTTEDDTVSGADGDDTVSAAGGNDSVFGHEGNDLLRGGRGEDTIFGGAGEDQLRGQRNADVLDGGLGDDNIKGGGGNDTLLGGEGDDFLNGATRADFIDGGAGDDRLIGRSFDDTLIGGEGDDSLNAGGDNDRLDGGAGNDTLKGGAGADVFAFDVNFGVDDLVDLDLVEDRLEFSAALAAGRSATELAALAEATDTGFEMDFGDGNVLRLTGLNTDVGLAGQIDILDAV